MVTFDRPGDAGLTWWRDDHQCPQAAGPLAQSAYFYMFQNYTAAQRKRGQSKPALLRICFMRGHFYVHVQPPGGPMPEAGVEALRLSPITWEQEYLPLIRSNLDRLKAVPLESLADDQLTHSLQEALKVLAIHWEIHFLISPRAYHVLTEWYKQRFPGATDDEIARLVQGQTNASVESGHALWKLSNMLTRGVADALRSGERARLPEPFRQAFEAYLDQYGRRPAVHCDIGTPTWLEEPAPVVHTLLRYAEQGAIDPYEQVRQLAAEREAFTAEVRSRLAPEERPAFNEMLALARAAVRMQEDQSFWIEQQTCSAVRRVCAEFGRRMAEAGVLPSLADVSLVTLPELLRYGLNMVQPQIPQELESRRVQHEANLQWQAPAWVGAPPEEKEPPAVATAEPAVMIRWLETLGRDDVHLAGGKGANLGELARAGVPIPQGFVVTTEAFRQRDDIARAVAEAYAKLGGGPVAVRSSATAEDMPGASFAGQFESYLNVEGTEAVLAAIHRCWASLESDRAAAYQAHREAGIAMAVVVQRMVAAEAAGVLFTTHPVTGRHDHMVIEGVRGLGDALVSGKAAPDHWVVDAHTGTIVDSYCDEEPVLTSAGIAELTALARQVRDHFGCPQDIEWALAGGRFYLVQARPITTHG